MVPGRQGPRLSRQSGMGHVPVKKKMNSLSKKVSRPVKKAINFNILDPIPSIANFFLDNLLALFYNYFVAIL